MALTTAAKVVGSFGLVAGAANILGVAMWGYPIVYCLAVPYTLPIYTAWGGVVLYLIAAYTLYQLATGRKAIALTGAAVFIAVIELPRIAHQLFSMGASCD